MTKRHGVGGARKPGAVRVIQFVSVFFVVFLLGMLAWPSVEPHLNKRLRKVGRRGRRAKRYFQD